MNTTRLVRFSSVAPFALVIAVEHHVHALEHEALRIVLQRDDALAAQDVRALGLHQVLDEGEELVRIERLVGRDRDRLHLLVVIVLQPAVRMRMAVIVPMIMVMIVIVIVVMIVGLEERRLDVEDALEIERVAVQHLVERDLRALRAVQLGIGIDAADARLDLAQLGVGHQIGLVDQDHVREGDLVLRLGRVLQPVAQPLGVRDGHHRIEPGLVADVLVDEEGLRHRRRIGEARWSRR